MSHDAKPSQLLTSVRALRAEVKHAVLNMDTSGVDEARQERRRLLSHLDDYIVPRLVDQHAPLLAVVGGSTGAGKSTLVNSLAGSVVSRSGVLRPTTRASVLMHHPEDRAWFTTRRILPGLERIQCDGKATTLDATHGPQDPYSLRLVEHDALPPGVAVLDAPDLDSVVEENRTLAQQLMAAADLWLFVTTPSRYADAVPWKALREAAQRGASVAIVLDRVTSEQVVDIRDHLMSMLASEGLKDSPLFVVPESEVDDEGLLPAASITALRSWLVTLSRDVKARHVVVSRTLSGAVASLQYRGQHLIDASTEQVDTVQALEEAAWDAAQASLHAFSTACVDGSLVRGEVLGAWHDFIDDGAVLHRLTTGRKVRGSAAELRDDLAEAVVEEAMSSMMSAVSVHTTSLHKALMKAWRKVPGGTAIVAQHTEAFAPPPTIEDRADELARSWIDAFPLHLDTLEVDRKARARMERAGEGCLTALAAVVMLGAQMSADDRHTPSYDATDLARRTLIAILGDEPAMELITAGHSATMDAISRLFEEEVTRIQALLSKVPVDRAQSHRLRQALAAVKDAT